ncbi:MAG TPA: PEP-CTERM sorting domain-containing protein [Nitrospiria bacterium]|jgi:hypothetical protein
MVDVISPGIYDYGAPDWFLEGSGDFNFWLDQVHTFSNVNGTRASLQEIFQQPPAMIRFHNLFSGSNSNPSIDPGGYLDPIDPKLQITWTRIAAVPEPSVIFLLGSGLVGLAFFKRKLTG